MFCLLVRVAICLFKSYSSGAGLFKYKIIQPLISGAALPAFRRSGHRVRLTGCIRLSGGDGLFFGRMVNLTNLFQVAYKAALQALLVNTELVAIQIQAPAAFMAFPADESCLLHLLPPFLLFCAIMMLRISGFSSLTS
jgi:hypothetical protein